MTTLLTCSKCKKEMLAYVPIDIAVCCRKMKQTKLSDAEAKKKERQLNRKVKVKAS